MECCREAARCVALARSPLSSVPPPSVAREEKTATVVHLKGSGFDDKLEESLKKIKGRGGRDGGWVEGMEGEEGEVVEWKVCGCKGCEKWGAMGVAVY